jgi:hypothetical protein
MIAQIRLVAAVVLLSTLVAASDLPQAARGTLVRGTPIVIETHGRGASRAFTLVYERAAPRPDAGSAVLAIDERRELRAGRRLRHLSGTELLRGEQGSLTLRWSGEQSKRAREWGSIEGTWRTVAGTGAYASCKAGGSFTSDARLASRHYRGLLIIAL